MKYGLLFAILGSILVLQAAMLGGPYWLLLWPGVSFGLVASAYFGLGPRIFGKRPTGTMAWPSLVALLPYLLLTWFAWHLVRLASREDCCNEVMPGLIVGRRPLAGEVPEKVRVIVDLTAEFPEPRAVRNGREYLSVPMLDTGIAPEDAFAGLVRRIAECPEAVYIHCAQGHGRTGTVAAAVLLVKGHCATVEDAVRLLRSVRPGLDLGKDQMAFLRRMFATDALSESTVNTM